MNDPVGIEHANAEAAKRIAELEKRIRKLEAIIETDYVNLVDTVDALEREEKKNKSLRDALSVIAKTTEGLPGVAIQVCRQIARAALKGGE